MCWITFRAGQRVNLDQKGFSKGSFTGKIQTKRFSKGFFTRKVQTKRFSKGLFAEEIQTKRFSKGFFTGEIQTKRFSKDSRKEEDPVQTPPLPPSGCLWHLPLTWNLKYFCLFAIIMQLSSCKDKITAIITDWKCNYPNVRQPSGRQRFSSFSMLQAMIFLIEKSVAMLKAKIFLIETSLSMSKGFLDHNLFHDPNVTTIHRDYPDNRAKDVRISILWPALLSRQHL